MGLDGLDEPDVGLEKGEFEEDCTTINIRTHYFRALSHGMVNLNSINVDDTIL